LPRATQVRLRQLDDQVIMVVHQHESMQPQPEPRHHFSEQLAEVLPIPIVPVNGAPFIAPPGEMIPSAGPLDSQWSGHAIDSTQTTAACQL